MTQTLVLPAEEHPAQEQKALQESSRVPAATTATSPRTEEHVIEALARCPCDLDRYLYLRDLRDNNEALFFSLLIDHAHLVLPLIYTPTVGEACQKYSHLPIRQRGLFLSYADKGNILKKLREWPEQDIRVAVVTDGERILGLGDLGYGGMGISEGKILLYSVMAGVPPSCCLPLCLDVGTNNPTLLTDPKYKGLRLQRQLTEGDGQSSSAYDELVEELMSALRAWRPHMLLQFEDFGNKNAFRLLNKYRGLQCSFNDDIQGTACIALAGLLSALRVTKQPLGEQRVLFLGAGEAGTGIGHLVARAMHKRGGVPLEKAMASCLYMDSHGLVCAQRKDLGSHSHKLPFAHEGLEFKATLEEAVETYRPTILIGVSTQAGAFTPQILSTMAKLNPHGPIIFPLSNPTSKAECTFQEAYTHTGGTVVFASGSPFPPIVTGEGEEREPSQANNAYVFGPIGMAALLTHCSAITDDVFLSAAEALAHLTPQACVDRGMLFPDLDDMKSVAPHLIADVAKFMVAEGLGTTPPGCTDWLEYVREHMWQPERPPSAQ